jgi:ssDNA-binding Zn-finger/Zn-ribbon topoisomerase 1
VNSIITFLIAYNQFLIVQIYQLLVFIAKNIPLKSPKYDSTSPKYKKLTVDRLPLIERPEIIRTYDYKVILNNFKIHSGKELKPVKPRKGKVTPADVICPHCGTPHIYIYDNNGGRGQFLCKVCDNTFFSVPPKPKSGALYCPFCGQTLAKKKERKNFNIYKCVNNKCSFYLDSLKSLSPEDLAEYQRDKHKFKLRYIYREFTIDFFKVDLSSMPKGAVNLTFRNFSAHIMGLCLTYHVNLGLSTRATARALWEIHQVKISHVMVSNYAKTAAALVKPFVDSFDYHPTNYLAGDETYIKVKGIKHYVWFIMDPM